MTTGNRKRPLIQPVFEFKYVWQEDDTLEVHLKTEGEALTFDGVYARLSFDIQLHPNEDEYYALFRYGLPEKLYMGSKPRSDIRCISEYGLLVGAINKEAHRALLMSYPSNNLSVVSISNSGFTTTPYQDTLSAFDLVSKDSPRKPVALIDQYAGFTILEDVPYGEVRRDSEKENVETYEHSVLVKQLGIVTNIQDVRDFARQLLQVSPASENLSVVTLEVVGTRYKLLVSGYRSTEMLQRLRGRGLLENALGGKVLTSHSLTMGELVFPSPENSVDVVTINGYTFKEHFEGIYVLDVTQTTGDSTKGF